MNCDRSFLLKNLFWQEWVAAGSFGEGDSFVGGVLLSEVCSGAFLVRLSVKMVGIDI